MLDINFSQQNRAVQQMHFEIKNCWVGKSSEKWDWFLFILSNLLIILYIYLILPFIMMWYWIIWLFCSYFCTWGRWKASRWWDVFFHRQKACEFFFLWSFTFFYLKHEKGCNALRGCFETLSEKEQFRRIGKTIWNETGTKFKHLFSKGNVSLKNILLLYRWSRIFMLIFFTLV